jgi:hypothetical protein
MNIPLLFHFLFQLIMEVCEHRIVAMSHLFRPDPHAKRQRVHSAIQGQCGHGRDVGGSLSLSEIDSK